MGKRINCDAENCGYNNKEDSTCLLLPSKISIKRPNNDYVPICKTFEPLEGGKRIE